MTPPRSDKAAVWLIEDHEDFRQMVAEVINHIPGLHCPRAFTSCEDTFRALDNEPAPQVILSDVGLPGISGIDGIRKIKTISPATHIIVLTVYDDPEKVFQAICAGASGYLLKNCSREAIGTAIQEVLTGGAPMHPKVARLVLEKFAAQHTAYALPKQEYGLSPRENEILELMVKGFVKKEIADKLSVSYHTIDFHMRHIYQKLHVNTQAGAVAKAVQERLINNM